MSVSVTLQKSTAGNLDAVSSITQHIVLIIGLLFLLGFVGVAFNESEIADESEAASITGVATATVDSTKVSAVEPARSNDIVVTPVKPKTTVASKPLQSGVLEYVKKRYRVSPEAVLPVVEVAELVGRERRIDPLLILAIIGVESSFNPFAESAMGARGLMQVIPRFQMDKVPTGTSSHKWFDPAVNIRVGVRVLEDAIRRRGDLTAGLQSYSGSTSAEGSYADKVLAEKARLEKAARRAPEPNA